MSLGYSIGDIVILGNLAWDVYKSCKHAPESFGNISLEVLSLHAVLKEFEDNLVGHVLNQSQQKGLQTVGEGCRKVLNDLQGLVTKYESLGTNSKRTWDRLGWNYDDVTDLRSRLTSNTVLLTAYISTSQVVVQSKLDKFLLDFQRGKRESSVISNRTVDSLSADEKQTWRIIRKELEDTGVTIAAFDANREFIIQWFRDAIVSGTFQEQTPHNISSNQSSTENLSTTSEEFEIHAAEQTVPRSESLPSGRQRSAQASSRSKKHSRKRSNPQDTEYLPIELDELGSTLGPLNHRADDAAINKDHAFKPKPSEVVSDNKRVSRVTSLVVRFLGRDKQLRLDAIFRGTEDLRGLIRRRGSHEETPLINASKNGQRPLVELLLKEGANVNAADVYKATALIRAAENGHFFIVDLLLRHSAEVDATDIRRATSLIVAANQGHEPIVRRLLDEGADISLSTNSGQSALYGSIDNEHEKVTQLLLNASDRIKDGYNAKLYALSLAVCQNHKQMVKRLLDAGVNVNSKMNHQTTALPMAGTGLSVEIIRSRLIERSHLGLARHQLGTILNLATWAGNPEVVKMLLDGGANVNARNDLGLTALKTATLYDHANVVKILLEAGADVNAGKEVKPELKRDIPPWMPEIAAPAVLIPRKGYHSMTASDIAIVKRLSKIFMMLIEAGAIVEPHWSYLSIKDSAFKNIVLSSLQPQWTTKFGSPVPTRVEEH